MQVKKVRGLCKIFIFTLAACIFVSSQVLACGIEGTAKRTDDSKVDGTATVSTSWNSKKAFPRDGYYTLDLGSSACGESVDVYVNGYSIGRYKIPKSGNATVNITLKGMSDVPLGR